MRTAIEKRGVAVLVMAGDTALVDAVDERVFTVRRTDPVTVHSPGGTAGGRRRSGSGVRPRADVRQIRSSPARRKTT